MVCLGTGVPNETDTARRDPHAEIKKRIIFRPPFFISTQRTPIAVAPTIGAYFFTCPFKYSMALFSTRSTNGFSGAFGLSLRMMSLLRL